jgi:hypothetical protein
MNGEGELGCKFMFSSFKSPLQNVLPFMGGREVWVDWTVAHPKFENSLLLT